MSGLLYLDRLSPADLTALAAAAGDPGRPDDHAVRLRSDPDRIGILIEHPSVYRALFGSDRFRELVFASPFLAFSVLLARVAQELAETQFVDEWVGPRRSVPLFDAPELRAFAEDRMRRIFLADLLTSYTQVASGTVWMRTARGWRRRRYSELDPVHLAQLIESASDRDRAVLYRRLGDLSLFLTGVFPDHAGTRFLGGPGVGRVRRAVRFEGGDVAAADEPDEVGPMGLLEEVGRRSYLMAVRATSSPRTGMARVLEDVADGFSRARRVLNFLTKRHLFPVREHWFRAP